MVTQNIISWKHDNKIEFLYDHLINTLIQARILLKNEIMTYVNKSSLILLRDINSEKIDSYREVIKNCIDLSILLHDIGKAINIYQSRENLSRLKPRFTHHEILSSLFLYKTYRKMRIGIKEIYLIPLIAVLNHHHGMRSYIEKMVGENIDINTISYQIIDDLKKISKEPYIYFKIDNNYIISLLQKVQLDNKIIIDACTKSIDELRSKRNLSIIQGFLKEIKMYISPTGDRYRGVNTAPLIPIATGIIVIADYISAKNRGGTSFYSELLYKELSYRLTK